MEKTAKLEIFDVTKFHENIKNNPEKSLTMLTEDHNFAFTRRYDTDPLELVIENFNNEIIGDDGVSQYRDIFFELANQNIKESYKNPLRGKDEKKIIKLIDKRIKNKNKRKFFNFLLTHASFINANMSEKKRISLSEDYLIEQLTSGNRDDLVVFFKNNPEWVQKLKNNKTKNNSLHLALKNFSDLEKDEPLIKLLIITNPKMILERTNNGEDVFSIISSFSQYQKELIKIVQKALSKKEIDKSLAKRFAFALDHKDYTLVISLFMENPHLVNFIGKSGKTILYYINHTPNGELDTLKPWVKSFAPGLKEIKWSMSFN